ncbi:MAG: hypothetical protein LBT47_04275 [Deltaproteobacteria bacterium]|nr:hypothetical protein [Deltaproteobacteria bacterium]
MPSLKVFYGLSLEVAKSTDNLAQVQAGFSTANPPSQQQLTNLLYIGAAIVVVLIIAGLINWRRKKKRIKKGWSSITNSQSIWEILTKAISRNAHFVLDIYDANRSINYKGELVGLEDNAYLVLSLSETPSTEADFTDLPGVIHINYRPSVKESVEHYQFATKVLSIRFVKVDNWREAQLLLPVPKVITSAQRRNYLRLEPAGPMAFDCVLYNVPEGSIPDLTALEEICRGPILDISIGGAQIKLPSNITLRETQRFVAVMQLPVEELNLELGEPTLVVLIQLLSQEFIQASVQLGQQAHTNLRVRFLGRYLKDKLQGIWFYRGLSQASLEDLSHWMLAYQRYQIKIKSHLHSSPNFSRPPNMFPSQPPKRPPLRED